MLNIRVEKNITPKLRFKVCLRNSGQNSPKLKEKKNLDSRSRVEINKLCFVELWKIIPVFAKEKEL